MLHGKKGFEKLVWAAKNVLKQSLAWLFYDLLATNNQSGSISQWGLSLRTYEHTDKASQVLFHHQYSTTTPL